MGILHWFSEIAGLLGDLTTDLMDALEPLVDAVDRATKSVGPTFRRAAGASGRAATRFGRFADETWHKTRRAIEDAHSELEKLFLILKCILGGFIAWQILMIIARAYCPRWWDLEVVQNILGWMALAPLIAIAFLAFAYARLDYLLGFGAVKLAKTTLAKFDNEKTKKLVKTMDEIGAALGKLIVALTKTIVGGFLLTGAITFLVPLDKDPGLILWVLIFGGIIVVFRGTKMITAPATLALVVFLGIFFLGGRSDAAKRVGDLPSNAQKAYEAVRGRLVPPPPPPPPVWFKEHVKCSETVQPTLDLYDVASPDPEFRYMPQQGCFSEIIFPLAWPSWHIQALRPQQPSDLVAEACPDLSLAAGPHPPNSGAIDDCHIERRSDPRGFRTILVQGNVELLFTRKDR